MNRLIAETTVPYILSIADEANLEIWKKHFQKADSIYRLAQSLSLRYRVSENNEIKNTLDALLLKLKWPVANGNKRISPAFSHKPTRW